MTQGEGLEASATTLVHARREHVRLQQYHGSIPSDPGWTGSWKNGQQYQSPGRTSFSARMAPSLRCPLGPKPVIG